MGWEWFMTDRMQGKGLSERIRPRAPILRKLKARDSFKLNNKPTRPQRVAEYENEVVEVPEACERIIGQPASMMDAGDPGQGQVVLA